MIEMTDMLEKFLLSALGGMTLLLLACLVRAVLGPRYTDRVVALNLICTLVILMVCLLSVLLGEGYLTDVALLYGLLNLLAVAALSRVTIRRHRERKKRRGGE